MAVTYKYGIDFGTTNSSIALHYDEGRSGVTESHVFKVDTNVISRELMPSIVYLDEEGGCEVGTKARRKHTDVAISNKDKVLIRRIKLLLDTEKEDVPVTKMNGKTYFISDIIGIILRKIRNRADENNIINPNAFVFGVPVDYSDSCKRIMLEATVKAHFFKNIDEAEKNVEFMSEPVAVAVDYGLNLNSDKEVFVFDFGGGTLDMAVVRLHKSDDEKGMNEVIAKHRITLGGEYYTEMFFKKVFVKKYGLNRLLESFDYEEYLTADELWDKLQKDSLGQKLVDEIERTKCELSNERDVIFHWVDGDQRRNKITIDCNFTRDEFEEIVLVTLEMIRKSINRCLYDAGINKNSIDEVLMAGGSSLIPLVIGELQEYFGKEIVRNPSNNALTSIVKGLAVKGYQEDGNEWIEDVTDSDYGVWITKRQEIDVIVHKNTKISKTKVEKDNIESGISKDYQATNSNIPVIQVFQNDDKIGEFSLPFRGGGSYKIFFEIDKKHGWLTVHVYDIETSVWYDDVLEHNKIKL